MLLLAAAIALAVFGDRPPARNSLVRVVTISADRFDRGKLLDGKINILNQAAAFHPDIACLPEMAVRSDPEPVPGPTTTRLSEWARAHSCYIVAGLKKLSDGRLHSTAVLIDRHGELAGQFDEIHPDESQLRHGIVPGKKIPAVFQTDFGKIGIQICFDVNWWENWKRLKDDGARIIFFLATYPAAKQLSAIALANEVFIVSSTGTRAARIFDITGRVLATTGFYQAWTGAVLPLDRRLYEVDGHIQKIRLVQQKYGPKVDVTWYPDDDWLTLASLDPDLTVDDLNEEFGLTPLRQYRLRSEREINSARTKYASK